MMNEWANYLDNLRKKAKDVKMSNKYIRIKELVESGRLLLSDRLTGRSTCKLHAFPDKGVVKVCHCSDQYPDWRNSASFDKWHRWQPDVEEEEEYRENSVLGLLSSTDLGAAVALLFYFHLKFFFP